MQKNKKFWDHQKTFSPKAIYFFCQKDGNIKEHEELTLPDATSPHKIRTIFLPFVSNPMSGVLVGMADMMMITFRVRSFGWTSKGFYFSHITQNI